MNNLLELKTINELQNYKFFIPSYQRGYRWTKKEVQDLLNDIHDFIPRLISNDNDEKNWYCLQPIVLKDKGNNLFEVIDGQQRLTTIYLILFYLNQDFVESKRDKLFELTYETRSNSQSFLKELGIGNQDKHPDNIDYFYITQAYNCIAKWFENKEKDTKFDKGDFRSKFKFSSKIIWYQSYENDPIAIFSRINIGKIPLTNAELIKALFLNSSNFESGGESKRLRQKQFEIATEWDNIEHALQNDRLWYFITQNKISTNRIEFIFDLISENNDLYDRYSTFRFFNTLFQKKEQSTIESNWAKVKKYYQRFEEWYHERDLYHKIGYLLCVDIISVKELYKISEQITKNEFRGFLNQKIKESNKNIVLTELQYGDKEIKNLLLLYNILTMLNSPKDNSYFPFDIYKKGNWDIEHITSVKDAMPDKNRGEWLTDALMFIDASIHGGKEIIEQSKVCDCNDDDQFKILFEKIVEHFNSGLKEEDINDISNLTLLDSETNRGYKNAVFPLKRKTIIDRDKSAVFIPICTKNVFLKYFSDYPPRISFWTQDDRDNYMKDLENILNPYIN